MSLKIDLSGLPQDLSIDLAEHSMRRAFQRFQNIAEGSESDFFQLSSQQEYLEACQRIHNRFVERKTFLHLGVGGSSLGAEMLNLRLGRFLPCSL